MENNIIEIRNLNKYYGDFLALNNIDLDIPCGNIVGLLGPNASGKTTLLKVLANLLMKYNGSVKN